jgi:hypothetical protein
MPNVSDIVRRWLQANGYDGLFSEWECGCKLDDLMPCGDLYSDCEAGYIAPCPGPEECPNGGDCDFHIQLTKPEVTQP